MRFAIMCLVIALYAPVSRVRAQAGLPPPASTPTNDVCGRPSTVGGLTTTERSLLDRECLAIRATNSRDARLLQSLMADDYSITTSGGRTIRQARQDMVTRWTSAPPPGERGATRLVSVERVHVYATAGFVTGTMEDRSIVGSRQTCIVHAFTDWWERRQGDWVWVHSHESGAKTVACAGR